MSLPEFKDLIIGLTKRVEELIKLKEPEQEDKLSTMAPKIIKEIFNKIDEC